jgi:hypothetical protein
VLFYTGVNFTIEETDDAVESKIAAQAQAQPTTCIAQHIQLIQRFADFGKLSSPDQMVPEGDGIYAIKARCGLRAYGWYHSQKRGVFVISHYICKKKQKLDPADLARAISNRDSYERVLVIKDKK